MNKAIAFILTLAISLQALAVCEVPTQIKQGQASPCDGYVMSVETETKIRTDISYKQALIDNLTKTNDLQANLIKIQGEQVNVYNSELNKAQSLSTIEKVLYFGLGALVTGAVAYGTVRAIR